MSRSMCSMTYVCDETNEGIQQMMLGADARAQGPNPWVITSWHSISPCWLMLFCSMAKEQMDKSLGPGEYIMLCTIISFCHYIVSAFCPLWNLPY